MNQFDPKNFILRLSNLAERQFKQETLAGQLILSELKKAQIKFTIQDFVTFLPKVKRAKLTVDGKVIPAIATSFVSGKVEGNYNILSSLISSQKNLYDANINFNPRSKTISRSNHYFAPALAISKRDLPKLMEARKVLAEVKVVSQKHKSFNILIGNQINPKTIVFSHYDSIGPGAVDNASGVAISLDLIIKYPNLLKESLFVIAGNEELSYDRTVYWGHGYRVFEKKYFSLFKNIKKIIIADCVGQDGPNIFRDKKIIRLAFPIKNLEVLLSKIHLVAGSYDKLMPIYHSELDLPKCVKLRFLMKAEKRILDLLKPI